MGEGGSGIRDRITVGLAIVVGISPLLAVIVWGLRVVHHRLTPENEPSRRIAELAPRLCDIAAGYRPARSLVDWLNHPSRRDHLLIRDTSGRVLVVDWHGTPYFWKALGSGAQPLVDARGEPIGGDLSLSAIERLNRIPMSKLTLVSWGPDRIPNSSDDVRQTCDVLRDYGN
jgi:hypothetical protein